MPNTYAASPMSFIEKLFLSDSFTSLRKFLSFPINNMSSTYKTRKTLALPLTFLYTQDSSSFLMNPKPFTTSSKCVFQLRDACFNYRWLFEACTPYQHLLDSKNLQVVSLIHPPQDVH